MEKVEDLVRLPYTRPLHSEKQAACFVGIFIVVYCLGQHILSKRHFDLLWFLWRFEELSLVIQYLLLKSYVADRT